jgi:hypothetical protein
MRKSLGIKDFGYLDFFLEIFFWKFFFGIFWGDLKKKLFETFLGEFFGFFP